MNKVFDKLLQRYLSHRHIEELTTTQRDAIASPRTGTIIYNTTTNKINFYNGSAWRAVDDSAV